MGIARDSDLDLILIRGLAVDQGEGNGQEKQEP
jgi:hypothetical protein